MYREKTVSKRHQRDIFEATKDLKIFGLYWEQGVGKTKPTIDKFCYLYSEVRVQAMLVIAPNGVQRNWANDEIPAHMPDEFRSQLQMYVYHSGKAKQKRHVAARHDLLKHDRAPVVLCMSYNSIRTATGKAFARKFLLKYKAFIVVDESQRIKSPNAKVTQTVVAAGRYAEYKTILSGTPISQGAFDVYSQIMFMDENFWKRRGLYPFAVFKRYFGVWVTSEQFKEDTGFDRGYDKLVGYKNTSELSALLKLLTHRLTKEDAGLDLPPKVYTKRYFDLTPKQRTVYDQLRNDFVTHLPLSGDWLEAPETIVRITRLQQITCGYVAVEADEPVQRIDEKNPRLECFLDTLADCEGKAIIWSKFTPDIDLIMKALGDKAVRYDGLVSEDQRELNKRAFQEGDAQYFVGKPQAGATGLTLHAARSVHYYSNSYNYEHRAQSEDRAHRIGLDHSVLYYDYVASDTIDNDVVQNLRKKFAVASEILQDKPKEWI